MGATEDMEGVRGPRRETLSKDGDFSRFGSLHSWTPPNLLVFCRIIRKCSLKVITFSYPGNADRLAQLTNGVGMDMLFYPLRFHVAHAEARGLYGDNKSIFF